MQQPTRILVTGGAGFIGSHMCDALIANGAYVICLDNFFTGVERNIDHLLGHPRFHLIRHDIVVPVSVEIDEIYNLACPASPIQYQRDPVRTTRTSVVGAIHMLELAKRLNAKVLQASTSEIYGDPAVHPQHEDYWGNVNPIGARSCYNESKRCAETLFFDYWRQHQLRIKVARIFNTYGPRMHPNDGRVVSNFIVRALTGRDICIHGDGSQTRSFCCIDDLKEGLLRLMRTDDVLTGPINLGNPEEVSILQLAQLIVDLVGARSKIAFLPQTDDDPRRRRPDIARAWQLLEWKPTIGLREGLLRTILYFDQLLGNQDTDTHQKM
jgi:UDP-glucuronate decarboxylase